MARGLLPAPCVRTLPLRDHHIQATEELGIAAFRNKDPHAVGGGGGVAAEHHFHGVGDTVAIRVGGVANDGGIRHAREVAGDPGGVWQTHG